MLSYIVIGTLATSSSTKPSIRLATSWQTVTPTQGIGSLTCTRGGEESMSSIVISKWYQTDYRRMIASDFSTRKWLDTIWARYYWCHIPTPCFCYLHVFNHDDRLFLRTTGQNTRGSWPMTRWMTWLAFVEKDALEKLKLDNSVCFPVCHIGANANKSQ